MVKPEETTTDQMGRLHNKLVRMVDKSKLAPPETVFILRMLAVEIEQQFLKSINQGG